MTQSRAVQRLGGDPDNANNITKGQIETIYDNYVNGKLNQNSPLGFKMIYINVPCRNQWDLLRIHSFNIKTLR